MAPAPESKAPPNIQDVFLNFLPLSHTYEHTAGMMFPISLGAQIYFAEGADALARNLPEATRRRIRICFVLALCMPEV